MSLILRVNLLDGLFGKVVERDVVCPAPIVLGVTIVEGAGPSLSDGLSEIGRILNSEVRDVLLNSGGQLLRGEADASQVVHTTLQFCVVSIQKVHGGLDAIIDVNHGEESLGLKEALVVSIFKGLEEDLYNVNYYHKCRSLQVEYMAVPLKAYFSELITPG